MDERRTRAALRPWWILLLRQILLTGLVLCVFACFHHVLPRLLGDAGRAAKSAVTAQTAPVQAPRETPCETPAAEETAAPEEPPEAPPESPAERFAEHFSAEPQWAERSYSGPGLSVTVTELSHTESFPQLTAFVADIYLADVRGLRVETPEYGTFSGALDIAKQNGAVLAVNGDSMLSSADGFVLRNGEIFVDGWSSWDLCALFPDGSMEIYGPGETDRETLLAREPWQVWHFGPGLLDASGQPLGKYNISTQLQKPHPRTAIGYYEPGHYCFVVVDGRQGGYSAGADMDTLARLMSELGCKLAYNLDGGASSKMVFHGSFANRPQGMRAISDMLVLTEPGEDGA